MKIIHKTILKELSLTLILSLASLNFFLLMENLLRLSRLLTGVGASLSDMLRITLYLQPQIMQMTLPMSLLLSILLTYGRLNADNELIALRTAGMDFMNISRPAFIMGAGCFLAGLLTSFYVSPLSSGRLKDTVTKVIAERAPMAIEPGIFHTAFKDVVILVRDKPQPDTMKGIFIYDSRNKKEPRIMVAKEGRIYADNFNLLLYLKDGYIHLARPDSTIEIFFKGYNLSLNIAAVGQTRKEAEMFPLELLRLAREKDKDEKIPFYLEFHRRLSLPFLNLILMLLGPPLSLMWGKKARLSGLSIGVAVFAAFYVLLIYSENMAKTGQIPHYIGAWAPVVVIGIFSMVAFRRAGSR